MTPPEVCNDASDNDGNGLTDCRDPACAGEAYCTVGFTLMQTTDLHAHAGGYMNAGEYTPLDTTDDEPTLGGFSRLAAIMNSVKAAKAATNTPVMIVDSGDFHSGTLFDWSGASDPITLKFFQLMGYTATTIGNHDTDWTPDGLAMLYANAMAATPSYSVPSLNTNIVFNATDEGDDNLAMLETAGLIRRKLVVDLPNGLKIGFLGRMGMEPADQAKMSPPLTWDATDPSGAGYVAYWQDKVDDLRDNDQVDVVIMVTHGQLALTGTSEDRTLANLVDGIDFIAAGHSHVNTPEAILVGKTMIFSPFSFGQNLAQVDVTFNLATGTVDSSALIMHDVNNTVTADATIQGMVDQYVAGIDAMLFPAMGLTYDASLAAFESDFDVAMVENTIGENTVGDFVADAFRTVATVAVLGDASPLARRPFDVAVVPAGSIRDGLYHGNTGLIRFADAYALLSTGMSPYDPSVPGWPLVSVYLTAAELRDAAEVNSLVVTGMAIPAAQLYFSGMRYKVDPAAATFNTVWEVSLCGNALKTDFGGDGDFFSEECPGGVDALDITDNTVLYRVVVDLYTLYSLGIAADASFNNLSIIPKFADGSEVDLANPMEIMGTLIDRDPAVNGMQELKEWMTLPMFLTNQTYIDAFPVVGLPIIPTSVYGPTGTALGRATIAVTP